MTNGIDFDCDCPACDPDPTWRDWFLNAALLALVWGGLYAASWWWAA
jgi:hypothetical protein